MNNHQIRKKLIGITNRVCVGDDPVLFLNGTLEARPGAHHRKTWRYTSPDGDVVYFKGVNARLRLIAYFCGQEQAA